jgi:chromosome segregation ATPase
LRCADFKTFTSDAHLSLAPVDGDAIRRATERLSQAAEARTTPADVEAALERAKRQIEALAATADELQVALPESVGNAVREGLRAEAQPVARQLAEVRGLQNQVLRRLERLEGDLLAERHARVDDLALLVDLIASSWRGIDERLASLEQSLSLARVRAA